MTTKKKLIPKLIPIPPKLVQIAAERGVLYGLDENGRAWVIHPENIRPAWMPLPIIQGQG